MLFKNTLRLAVLSFISFSCSQKHDIVGEISGIGNDTIYVQNFKLSESEEEPLMDTIFAVNGKFVYDLPIKEPLLTILSPKKAGYVLQTGADYNPVQKQIWIFSIPENNVKISGELKDLYLEYTVVGSGLNEDYSSNRKSYKAYEIEKSIIEFELDTLMVKNATWPEKNALFQRRLQENKKIQEIQLNYFLANREKDISGFYLFNQPLDTVGKYYDFLSKSGKEGIFKEWLDGKFYKYEQYSRVKKAKERIQIGKPAPLFSLNDLDDQQIAFSPSGKKYVVLDFWGSWCAPCIVGIPKMKEYAAKYSDEVEFIGIACKDEKEKWKNTIKKHSLNWKQLFNVHSDFDRDVSLLYAVEAYPTKVIISPEGTILGIFSGEGEDFYNALDLIISKETDESNLF